METLDSLIREYSAKLEDGRLQKAYRGIIDFMNQFRVRLEQKYTGYNVSGLYVGYMDMTYFAITPPDLYRKKLKTAVVFLHEKCRFELWLAANNRKIQKIYAEMFDGKDIGVYMSVKQGPGVDAIVSDPLDVESDFDDPQLFMDTIEARLIEFCRYLSEKLKEGI